VAPLHARRQPVRAAPSPEFKSAWQDVDQASPADYAGYVTTTAWVSHLGQDPTTHGIVEDRNNPRLIKVALIALHAVYTLPGHPELIWATFQHVDAAGKPDTAPSLAVNPSPADPNNANDANAVSPDSFLLYHGGTPARTANTAYTEPQLQLDEVTQTFTGQQTSIYRMFPGSKSNATSTDDDVASLNSNVAAAFAQSAAALSPADRRMHYALVGATWMDKPALFAQGSSFQNDQTNPLLQGDLRTDVSQADERAAVLAQGTTPAQDLLTNGSDSPFSILAGEDRMSSTAMESFTQNSFFNCFSCHNTQAVTARGVPFDRDPGDRVLLGPKLINVSHVFSEFVLEETQ
jgi:hypothetical protein